MNKNTLMAFIFSIIVLILWSYYFNHKTKVTDITPPVFQGVKSLKVDKKNNAITLKWRKASDKSKVTYYVYYNINEKVNDLSTPYAITTNLSYTISDIDFNNSYYFMVKAVDSFNNMDTNTYQLFFKGKGNITKNYKEKEIEFNTHLVKYTLSTLGGRIKFIHLKKYKNIDNDKNVELLYYNDFTKFYYPLDLKLVSNGDISKFPINDLTVYSYKKVKDGIIFEKDINNLHIIKKYTFIPNSYKFYISITLKKKNKKDIIYNGIILKWQPTLGPLNKIDKYDKLEVNYFADGSLEKISFKGGFLKKKDKEKKIIEKREDKLEWVGFNNRYFVGAIIPKEEHRIDEALFYADASKLIAGILSDINKNVINENKEITFNYIIYAGPKLRDTFKNDKELNNLVRTIKFRKIFSKLGNWFLDVLIFFNSIFHSYGVAIILFTILIKLLLYPLTHKQFESMAKMQKIQPVINQLREQYKDNPKQMNAELMKVYKKYKVNPFGGCLPMILQIPIFFAIWDMLQYSLELRSASFLWIKSLALPDTIGHFAGIAINPLPIIMGITMIIQQKLSSSGTNQKAMMYLMPLIFLFIFWNMPSGLVLYWTLQNVLSIAQQYYLNKKINLGTEGGKRK